METKNLLDVSGKAAIVTGGALGIGFGIVERLVKAGAEVMVVDANEKALADVPNRLKEGKVRTLPLDVSKEESWEKAVKACVADFGKLDILVNNAGIYPQVPLLKMEPALFDKVYAVNLKGLAFLSKAAALQMARQGHGGRIINIASIDSLHPSMVGLAAYDASKGGVWSFTKNFAVEVAPHGILVNAIAPGGIATEGTGRPLEGSGLTPAQMKAQMDAFLARIPLKRMGVPDDIAKVVLFLASGASDYMTGSLVVVDGGMLLS
ncbi:MAG TPA: SDR family NAD(P)-dependent oxidoreductase [bacterium]|nr:SDR family NAD(P)-dependent oxidoreductase [bacterium]